MQAILIAAAGLEVGALMPEEVSVDNLLIYYAVLLVLAIPSLHLSATALFVCAAVMWIAGPLPMQVMADVMPAHTSSTPTSADGVSGAAGTISQLLFTGLHPILSYMTCLLVGLGLGRVRLRDTGIQVRVLTVGAALLICAQTASVVSYAFDGSDRLLTGNRTSMEVLVWAPEVLPTDSPWWPALIPALTDTASTIAAGLGVVAAAVGTGRDGSDPVHRPPGGAVHPGPPRPALSVAPPALGGRSAGCPDLAASSPGSGAAGVGGQHRRGNDSTGCASPRPLEVNTSQGRPPPRQDLHMAGSAANRDAVRGSSMAGVLISVATVAGGRHACSEDAG
ncbi:hypothetical protein [Kocuria rosea]|uniref:hypothetical protein n=1 Tax=Kocuria rosea TaxID=1275 RepID=UPI00254172EB|nr:hypothetical protein [Kocuria rosea]WIG18812.1 hypothetical protein QOY29_07815 [Kocuria rosea]